MTFPKRNSKLENINFSQVYDAVTVIRVGLNILSLIIAAILWVKFDFSFYYVSITLIIIFNLLCLALLHLIHYKPILLFKFLVYSKELLYKFTKFYKIFFLIAIGYFLKNIVNVYLDDLNFTDTIIFMLSMVSFVCLYRYKQEYEFKIQSAILEDNNHTELEDEEIILEEEQLLLDNNEIIKDIDLPLSEREKTDCIEIQEKIQNTKSNLLQVKPKKIRKEVKTIDDVFNLFRSIMPPEEAKKIPFKEFFYDYIAKEYSEHDFIGYNFHLRYKEGQLFKFYKNGKEEPYDYKTLEQHFSKFCKLAQL